MRGHEGNRRLHERWLVYLEHRKRPVIANVAIARELAGWCWSLATLEDNTGGPDEPVTACRQAPGNC